MFSTQVLLRKSYGSVKSPGEVLEVEKILTHSLTHSFILYQEKWRIS